MNVLSIRHTMSANAHGSVTTVSIPVGAKQTATGKETILYASARVDGCFPTLDAVLDHLDAEQVEYEAAPLSEKKDYLSRMSLPKVDAAANIRIQVRHTYTPGGLATLLRSVSGTAAPAPSETDEEKAAKKEAARIRREAKKAAKLAEANAVNS